MNIWNLIKLGFLVPVCTRNWFDEMQWHRFPLTDYGTWRTEKGPKVVKTPEISCITKLDTSILAEVNPKVTDSIPNFY